VHRNIRTLKDVVDWGLCTGCGACFYACGRGGISLANVESAGIRPLFLRQDCASCTKCLSICPGYRVEGQPVDSLPVAAGEANDGFGPALEIWEGHATDPEIRYQASSGGLLSALALYCLEKEEMKFVLHTGMSESSPWTNSTVVSRTRAEILERTGSRYAPASPCDGLGAIEGSDRPCVFIGKPCDAAAVRSLRRERPGLDCKVGLVLTFFCAGTPSSSGTLNLVHFLDSKPEEITRLRYRGRGWPGRFTVEAGYPSREASLSYEESWGQLAGYRPLRCHLCPDGLGQTADLACGDAWERFSEDEDPGRSIVLVRTERGREILHRAMAAGYVQLQPIGAQAVIAAQHNLLQRRKELFGRLLAMRLLAVPTPKFPGFPLRQEWLRIPIVQKLRTIVGTARRVLWRGQWKRRPVFPERGEQSPPGSEVRQSIVGRRAQ
jgi:coenzyme F420 hydrogenase subunit beta